MDFKNTVPNTAEREACGGPSTTSPLHTEHSRGDDTSPLTAHARGRSIFPSRGTPQQVTLYNRVLHLVSFTFGIVALALICVDLSLGRQYANTHATRLPATFLVVDAIGIAATVLASVWSLVYLSVFDRFTKDDTLQRKRFTVIDFGLWMLNLGIADTIFALRSNKRNCLKVGDVGGCQSSRRSLMIAAGVFGILLSVALNLRWSLKLHVVAHQPRQEQCGRKPLNSGGREVNGAAGAETIS